ncbi:MAG: TRAP transporter small permease [Alphaproteobacteria bacterium]|nr:TRAP transporter small permease [Alphaproteobacteria bacterium]
MRRFLLGFVQAAGLLTRIGSAAGALSLLLSLGLISYSVVARYVFNMPQTWVDELVGYLLVAVVMAAAADAQRVGEHISVDVLVERLPQGARKTVTAAGLAASAAVGGFLVSEGWAMVAFSRRVGEISTGHLEVPMFWPQLLVPVGGALLAVAALAGLARMAAGLVPFEPHESSADPEAGR